MYKNVPENYFQSKKNYRLETSPVNKYTDIKHLKGISFILKISRFEHYSKI